MRRGIATRSGESNSRLDEAQRIVLFDSIRECSTHLEALLLESEVAADQSGDPTSKNELFEERAELRAWVNSIDVDDDDQLHDAYATLSNRLRSHG